MSKPRRIENDRPVWWDNQERLDRLIAYCVQDVRTERALTKRLRPLSDFEQALFLLDMEINQRGVRIDLKAVRDADVIVKKVLHELNQEMALRTRNAVGAATQTARLRAWLAENGVDTDSVDKQAISATLELNLPANVRRVLEIRQEASKVSTSKLDAMKVRACADGRARENLMYHGASTGRWSARGIQLQNLPRPTLKQKDIDSAFEVFGARDPNGLALYGPPMSVVSDCLRGMVVADPGHELVRADFSNIEGRVLAWLAGEAWKLQAFRDYDAGVGPDLYKKAASAMLGVPIDAVDDKQRQIGKVSELALGYQGGHGAFISMAKNYGVTPADVAPTVKALAQETGADTWDFVARGYDPKNRFELPLDEWTALRIVIDAWRGAHERVVDFWRALDEAAMHATADPGRMVSAGPVAFASKGNVLWCKLPSGRLLAYVDPKIRQVETPWGGKRDAVTYMGVDSITRKWSRHKGYGGHWAENITQAAARDIMAEAMIRVEARGWPVVLTVHDEVVSEAPVGVVDAATYEREMSILPRWAEGLPVSAAGVVSKRYGK